VCVCVCVCVCVRACACACACARVCVFLALSMPVHILFSKFVFFFTRVSAILRSHPKGLLAYTVILPLHRVPVYSPVLWLVQSHIRSSVKVDNSTKRYYYNFSALWSQGRKVAIIAFRTIYLLHAADRPERQHDGDTDRDLLSTVCRQVEDK
jgi:hypothetical protein